MKVSLSTVQSLVDFELPPVDELVARVNAQLGGVEEIIDLGVRYKDALIVRVVEYEKHPNADKLSVCKVDDGGVRKGVERGENGLIQVVCGAPNVHADMWAVWLPPESVVPSTYDDKEPFKLSARELRGVLSQGMLAAGDELGINNDHDGIVEVTEDDLEQDKTLKAGASFAAVFGLDDIIFDIENKMFTHRPDCFGQLGVAREIAGILGHQFTSPEWYVNTSRETRVTIHDDLELYVFNDAGDSVPRFMVVAMRDVEVRPSPLWLQCALVVMGSKPISNIVDATNYIMLMTAQPTHAYDYDKLRGHKLGVRMAKKGEKITLLNDKTYELSEDDIVIADGEGAVGLAGIMGGKDTEVDNNTKNIVLECANFDMYTLRKTAMRHGLFTDALTRFNKGQSSLQQPAVLAQLLTMVGGEQASETRDTRHETRDTNHEIDVTADFINSRLGTDLEVDSIVELLKNVEISVVSRDSDLVTLSPPFWRTDIELPEDVVEEVGRLYGFDKLPRELPMRSSKPAPKNLVRETKRKIRESLSKAGVNEVLTYSFVHEKVLKNAEQDAKQAFKLSNALSPDLQYYRLSVLPSLLDKVHMNIKAGHDEFALFEIGKGHNKQYHADDDDGLPKELNFVDVVYARKKPGAGAPFYQVRKLVQQLADDFGFELVYKPISEPLDFPVTAPFDLERSALLETADGVFIGMIGELKSSVRKNFKLPDYTAAATLDLDGLVKAINTPRQTYRPLSKYPSTSQDISLKVASDTSYRQLFETAYHSASQVDQSLDIKLEPVTMYQANDDKETKTISFRLTVTSHEKTLSDDDVRAIVEQMTQAASQQYGAVVV